MKLDIKDKKLLFLLSKNARLNIAELAKLTKLSRDVVAYRLDKLEKSGIIKGFKTGINYRLLGIKEYDIYLRLFHVNEESLAEIVNHLCENRFVTWVGTTFGNYDVRISILARDNEHLNSLMLLLEKEFGNKIQDYEICPLIKKFKVHPEFLVSSIFKEIKGFKIPDKFLFRVDSSSHSPVKLDSQDRKIISILGKNCRTRLVEIASSVNMTPEGVKYKIKRLEQSGVIMHYTTAIDGPKLGKLWCVFLFKMVNMSEEKEKALESYIANHKNATASVKIMGKWNLGLTVYANDMREIQSLLMDFRNNFTENVKEYDSLLIFDTFKYPALAEGALD
ncbi:Lrp/AsnC family transcriptional regulator [Candidatus Woesearchaeota archaeon]|nr:Lrp/AsnC family transcriptional regulator [Candidatus Woesearchaeota archaeon]MBT3538420.1 Lrp/AsnC family transcriptional regulator [Candidatus Woesearchaeota archaeon]MBT4696870.1 Lrp/AsnC family transcriptional regulator [Candidatus Woesearchaeota archaeon]MBT7106124.1 Lrp/AsnC family transcriptional regulator [Candidatus Woesearchaeota archaeon]MBT7930978.1 Lrp/AsnC family transcriptional regulator [Candidatus Woesearchaeota archaeon]